MLIVQNRAPPVFTSVGARPNRQATGRISTCHHTRRDAKIAQPHRENAATMTATPIAVPASAERTPIRTFADVLQAMSQDPALAEAVRQHVLDDELRRLPAAFERLAATVRDYMTQTNQILARLEAGQEELRTGQNELQAKFLPIDARKMVGVIARELNVNRVVWLDNTNLLDIAADAGDIADTIPENELQSFYATDLALKGRGKDAERGDRYALIECSNTIGRNDIRRIKRNADLMTLFTGCPALPMMIGNHLPEQIVRMAEAEGVHCLRAGVRITRAT